MPANLKLSGFDEFEAMLKRLPPELADEGGAIVELNAAEAFRQMYARYPAESTLQGGLTMAPYRDRFGATVKIRERSKLAYIWEYGTVKRETMKHANRGTMPGSVRPGFVAIAVRTRRIIREALIVLMQRAGLTVTGS